MKNTYLYVKPDTKHSMQSPCSIFSSLTDHYFNLQSKAGQILCDCTKLVIIWIIGRNFRSWTVLKKALKICNRDVSLAYQRPYRIIFPSFRSLCRRWARVVKNGTKLQNFGVTFFDQFQKCSFPLTVCLGNVITTASGMNKLYIMSNIWDQ